MGQAADARSDIYSAGIMLYEMLTGQQPYAGDSPIQVAYQHVNSSVGKPSQLAPGLAQDLDELVQWCTAVDAENRPVDGTALLTELRHIRTTLSDEQLDHRQPSSTPGAMPAVPGRGDAMDQRTESIRTTAAPTEFIAQQSNPTTVMAASVPPRPRPGGIVSGVDTSAPQPGKRELKRMQRQEVKDRARRSYSGPSAARGQPSQAGSHLDGCGGDPRRSGRVCRVVLRNGPRFTRHRARSEEQDRSGSTAAPADRRVPVGTTGRLRRRHPAGHGGRNRTAARVPGPEIPAHHALCLKGPRLFALPGLTGGTLDEAKATLNAAEMALGNVTEAYDDKVPAGVVLSQDPAKGTEVRHGTPVALVVSKGPQPIPVPDVPWPAAGRGCQGYSGCRAEGCHRA